MLVGEPAALPLAAFSSGGDPGAHSRSLCRSLPEDVWAGAIQTWWDRFWGTVADITLGLGLAQVPVAGGRDGI